MKTFLTLLLFFVAFVAPAQADPTSAREELSWKYAEFVHAFREKNWSAVCGFVSSVTKAGFGPNEDGCVGVRHVFGENDRCWDEMMFALRQGCKATSSEAGLDCVAPPQWDDEAVVYLGARAGFTYNRQTGAFIATYLVCGGD